MCLYVRRPCFEHDRQHHDLHTDFPVDHHPVSTVECGVAGNIVGRSLEHSSPVPLFGEAAVSVHE
jgi:hypothetical protein